MCRASAMAVQKLFRGLRDKYLQNALMTPRAAGHTDLMKKFDPARCRRQMCQQSRAAKLWLDPCSQNAVHILCHLHLAAATISSGDHLRPLSPSDHLRLSP